METPRRVTSRRFCHIDCADGANIERAKHAYFQLSTLTLPLRFSTNPFITAAAPYKKNSVPQIR